MKAMRIYRGNQENLVTDWHGTYEEAHEEAQRLRMYEARIQQCRIRVTKEQVLNLLNGKQATLEQ